LKKDVFSRRDNHEKGLFDPRRPFPSILARGQHLRMKLFENDPVLQHECPAAAGNQSNPFPCGKQIIQVMAFRILLERNATFVIFQRTGSSW
jgi:hypothetical protein